MYFAWYNYEVRNEIFFFLFYSNLTRDIMSKRVGFVAHQSRETPRTRRPGEILGCPKKTVLVALLWNFAEKTQAG